MRQAGDTSAPAMEILREADESLQRDVTAEGGCVEAAKLVGLRAPIDQGFRVKGAIRVAACTA